MDMCHLKNAELEPRIQKCKGRVVLRGDIVKDDSWAHAVFTEQGSSVSQVTAAKVMDVIARRPDCDGQAADAVSGYTQVKTRTLPYEWDFRSQHVLTCGSYYTLQMAEIFVEHWRSSGSSWTKCVRTPTCWITLGNTIRRSSIGIWMGKSAELGMPICSSNTRFLFIGVRGRHQNGWKEAKEGSHVEEINTKRRSWRTNVISWSHMLKIHSTWMKTEWNYLRAIQRNVESRISAGAPNKLPGCEKKKLAKTVAWSYDMEGRARKMRWDTSWVGKSEDGAIV